MRYLYSLLTALLVLGLAGEVRAATAWNIAPDGTGQTVGALSPTGLRVAYHNISGALDAADDSLMLAVGQCGSIDLRINSDLAATTVGAEGYLHSCMSNSISVNTCGIVYNDAGVVTLNGDETAGRAAIYGESAVWVYWDTTVNGSSKTARVWVKCNP
jgi:hypothetical protein